MNPDKRVQPLLQHFSLPRAHALLTHWLGRPHRVAAARQTYGARKKSATRNLLKRSGDLAGLQGPRKREADAEW